MLTSALSSELIEEKLSIPTFEFYHQKAEQAFADEKYPLARINFNEALAFCSQEKYPDERRVKCHYGLGKIFLKENEFKNAWDEFSKALEESKHIETLSYEIIAGIYLNLSASLLYLKNFDHAKIYFQSGIDIASEKYGRKSLQIAQFYNIFITICREVGIINDIKKYHYRYYKIMSDLESEPAENRARCKYLMAGLCRDTHAWGFAIQFHKQALQILEDHKADDLKPVSLKIEIHTALGRLLWKQKEFQESLEQFKNALTCHKMIYGENHFQLARLHYSLAIVYNRLNKFENAIQHQRAAIDLLEIKEYKLRDSKSLVLYYKKLGYFYTSAQMKEQAKDAYRAALQNLPGENSYSQQRYFLNKIKNLESNDCCLGYAINFLKNFNFKTKKTPEETKFLPKLNSHFERH